MSIDNDPRQKAITEEDEPLCDPADQTAQVRQYEQIDLLSQQLSQELQPQGIVEKILVRELARRAATMDFLENASGAVQRESTRCYLELGISGGDLSPADAALIAAVSAGKLVECERRIHANSKAFYRGLGVLQNLQARRSKVLPHPANTVDEKFATEAACEAYLQERFERRDPACSRCGKTGGHWLASRRCWECRHCKHQTGIRVNTVMERSPLPLQKWFAAIRALLLLPTISTAELAQRIGINRVATVRSMASKIRHSTATEDASRLLVGLDAVDT